jgi:hydroxymethylbilane synthase
LPDGFAIAAIPPRVDPRDALVSVVFAHFADLPAGSLVGTSSLRRQAQLRAERGDLQFVEFRGNVDTRLRKLAEGQVQAIVLAAAGLERLGKTEWVRERFQPGNVCPAAGQGALAIECRADDSNTHDAVHFLDDADTRFAVTAERAALNALGGGCQVPIGAYCFKDAAGFILHGAVAQPDGGLVLRSECRGEDAASMGRDLAASLLSKGAAEILTSMSESK